MNLLPKAELHLHLEGSATPELIRRIAARNKVKVNPNIFKDENNFAWDGFLNFIDVYEQAAMVIRQPQDYYDITFEYLESIAKDGAIYVEMIYSPEHAELASGIPSHEHLLAIQQAIDDAKEKYDITGAILMAFVRHYGVDSVMKVAHETIKEDLPCIVGVNLAGDEVGFPPAQFAKAFELVAAHGLGTSVHAGEMRGPESVYEAIRSFPVDRIGHGVRSIEDPNLIAEIKDKNLTLEICIASNLALNVYPDIKSHPFKKLFDLGVNVTLNSDDPPYFNASLQQEYDLAKHNFGLNDQELLQITKNAINAAFVDEKTKQYLLTKCI